MKQSVTNDWGGSKLPVEEDDKDFLENKQKLSELEKQLTETFKKVESLVNAQQDMGETMGELGLSFIKLAKFENEQAWLDTQKIHSANMKCVCTAAVKASRLYRGLNVRTVEQLDKLDDCLGLMLAAQNAFSDRSRALLTLQTLLSELSSLHSKAQKLEAASSKIFGGDISKINKLEELKEVIRVTEDAKQCAVKDYQLVKDNNRSEIARLNKERKANFFDMLNGFVTNQIAYAEKIGNEWGNVAAKTRQYARESA